MNKDVCKYFNFHGADDEGDYVSCDLEKNPKIMCNCDGGISLCRNKEKLKEVSNEFRAEKL
jgi:hypothetical protein